MCTARFHDPNPERQAKRVLLNKWNGRPMPTNTTPDVTVDADFHQAFTELASSARRSAMRVLFPLHGNAGEYSPPTQ